MKTSDSDRKVNRNIYPDAVNVIGCIWIIEQARSSFHLSVLESVCVKTQNPVLCRQKEFVFSLGLFK